MFWMHISVGNLYFHLAFKGDWLTWLALLVTHGIYRKMLGECLVYMSDIVPGKGNTKSKKRILHSKCWLPFIGCISVKCKCFHMEILLFIWHNLSLSPSPPLLSPSVPLLPSPIYILYLSWSLPHEWWYGFSAGLQAIFDFSPQGLSGFFHNS